MRKLVPLTSFIPNGTLLFSKRYISDSASSFSFPIPWRERLLRTFLNTEQSELFLIEHDEALSVRRAILMLKEHGVVRTFRENIVFNDYPPYRTCSIQFNPKENVEANTLRWSWGRALPDEPATLAFSRALGELLERHSSTYNTHADDIYLPRIRSGDASWMYPYIPKCTQTQIKGETTLIHSPKDMQALLGFYASSLTGDRNRFFLISNFYWGGAELMKMRHVHHPTSNGSGGGATRTRALLSAFYELIERDHFLLHWFSGVHPKRIANDTVEGAFGAYIRDSERRYNLEVYFLDTRYDTGVLACTCIIVDPVLHRFAMGGKAGIHAEDVLRGAFSEALGILGSTRMQEKERVGEDELRALLKDEPYSTHLRHKRVYMYMSPLGIDIVRKTFLSGDTISYNEYVEGLPTKDSKEEELAYLVSQMKRLVHEKGAGYHAYAHHFGSELLDMFSYHASHVYIPSFLKLHLNEVYATPLSERLFTFMKERGKPFRSEADLNRFPHFFS